MSVSHHLTDETLQDYTVGALSTSMETLVACHLSMCSHCRARASVAEDIGGNFLDHIDPSPVNHSAVELVLKEDPAAGASLAGNAPSSGRLSAEGIPMPLARLLPKPLEELDWRRVAPGIKQFNLSSQHRRYGAFQLLHLAPGVVLSAHAHNDRELTYVVKGSYQDEIGRFKAGDIADLDNEVAHQPVVDTDEPCIALIASSSPVRYSGMLGKIMQPFVGI